MRRIVFALLFIIAGTAAWGVWKPLPEGVPTKGDMYTIPAEYVRFLRDVTYRDKHGIRVTDHQIFNEIFSLIQGAEHYILVDMFLFNDFLGTATSAHRALSKDLTDALIAKKRENPLVAIHVITDPINTAYGGYTQPLFTRLRSEGIPVTITNLSVLRDSNPLWSGAWRTLFQWIPDAKSGPFPNALDPKKPKVSVQSYLSSLNLKANHRKIIVADTPRNNGARGITTLITSANPHDGSSAHSNVAFAIDDGLWSDALSSERAVAKFSSGWWAEPTLTVDAIVPREDERTLAVQLVTEGAIKEKVLAMIEALAPEDTLDMAMFYLSDRDVIRALKETDRRGVTIRLLLDANKDAFGKEKNGIPNRPVAHELMTHTSGNTTIRWCNTSGEQCHSKMVITKQGETLTAMLGSANLTRRNIGNFNLETNVVVAGKGDIPALKDATTFFEDQWTNNGAEFSLPYEAFAEQHLLKTLWYRFGEWSGVSWY